jgi:hypothetical protein
MLRWGVPTYEKSDEEVFSGISGIVRWRLGVCRKTGVAVVTSVNVPRSEASDATEDSTLLVDFSF